MSGVEERKARKSHTCSFCDQPITKGDLYTHIRITPWSHPDNEGFATWRAHPACWNYWHLYGHDLDYVWDAWDMDAQRQFREALAGAQAATKAMCAPR